METSINHFNMLRVFLKEKIQITAGPTREYIDPVRYISKGSSKKWVMPLRRLCTI